MTSVNHAGLTKVFKVFCNHFSIFDKHRPSTYSFKNIPMLSSIFTCNWSWEMVWQFKFICIQVFSIGINPLSLELSWFGQPKSPHSWMVFIILIYIIFIFYSTSLCDKRCRDIFDHVKISTIDDCVNNILFYVRDQLPAAAYCYGVFGKYPRASPFVSLTTNSKLESSMLIRANPPVSLVWKGESVVFRVKIYIDGGRPWFIEFGLVQLYPWQMPKWAQISPISKTFLKVSIWSIYLALIINIVMILLTICFTVLCSNWTKSFNQRLIFILEPSSI